MSTTPEKFHAISEIPAGSTSPANSDATVASVSASATSTANQHASASTCSSSASHLVRAVTPIPTILNRPDKAIRDAKSVRGEMHNVLALMRRWARKDRFFREIPIQEESPILRSFKMLHEHMQNVSNLNRIDTTTYLKPFLEAIADGGEVTGILSQSSKSPCRTTPFVHPCILISSPFL